MSSSRRMALFIDGPNLYATAKMLGFDVDFKRLLNEFQSRATIVRALYYTPIIEVRNIRRSVRSSIGSTTTVLLPSPR